MTNSMVNSKPLSLLVDYSDSESAPTTNDDTFDNFESDNNLFDLNDFGNDNEDNLDLSEKNVEANLEPDFILTKNDKPKMIFEDHEYVQDKIYNDKIYWKCAVAKPIQCKSRIHTDLNRKVLKVKNNFHYHEDDLTSYEQKISKQRICSEIKSRAATTLEKPRTIIKDVLANYPVSLASELPPIHNLKQQIVRKRAQFTKSGKLFVLYDSGQEDQDRIIILATEDNIEILNSETVWFVDGTFSVTPNAFFQIFTINVNKNNRNLALVYSFLPNKQQITYTRLFNILKSNGLSNIPQHIMCDFELAVINSIKKCFPGTNIGGCYFHLTANIWKHVTNGPRKAHKTDAEFRKYYNYLKVLPFIPTKNIVSVFNRLKSDCPASIVSLYDYFEEYYIGKQKEDGSKTRVIPSFPIPTWNVLKRISSNLPRSNNSIEAWHKALAQDINSHPEINKFVNHLIKEQNLMEICLEQIRTGVVFPRDSREIKRDESLLELSRECSKFEPIEYLERVIKLIK
ncbi:unnamed protein product [Brachionus calyciflorus]|uniref:MULE transposase domain-containing protein n=1 Tax=Brachionus calyciflorus TaxID=104777 RepID=A0A813UW71_9BILA|nr:unnamed protein product [Brachionus calyciflorus]